MIYIYIYITSTVQILLVFDINECSVQAFPLPFVFNLMKENWLLKFLPREKKTSVNVSWVEDGVLFNYDMVKEYVWMSERAQCIGVVKMLEQDCEKQIPLLPQEWNAINGLSLSIYLSTIHHPWLLFEGNYWPSSTYTYSWDWNFRCSGSLNESHPILQPQSLSKLPQSHHVVILSSALS